ncbi:MAG TPA: AAA family ATPase [Syntrophales bacterium]|nr:AAA family ATPase [Syntrophales bacterium]
MTNKKIYFEEVPVEKLRWRCNPESLKFQTTEECEYKEGIIGQDRAVRALKLGLTIESPGYNIYVSGRTGTGRTSTIMRILNKLDSGKGIPKDICYVNNFKNPDMPKVIFLPAGMGQKFARDMDDLIDHLIKQIPLIFESDVFKKASEEIIESYRSKQKEMMKEFNDRILKDGFQLVAFQIGPFTRQDIVPVYEGKPVPFEQLEALAEQGNFSKEELERIKKKLLDYRIELDSLMREMRENEKKIRKEIDGLEYRSGLPVVSELISDIRVKYSDDNAKINEYLDEVQEHILSNLKMFKEKEEEQQPHPPIPLPFVAVPQPRFTEFKVNVLVDNSQTKKTPVILETDPTYKNLFGTIEREVDRAGFWRTDFTKIKAGSLLRANGGYLVFMALDALIEPGVWYTLKRTLKNRSLNMQPFDPYGIMPTALKPEAIPLDVKVVMVGDDYIYRLLYVFEEDFKKIFKTKSDFDTEMPNEEKHVDDYVCFIKRIIDDEKLLQFDRAAVASIIEHGVRLTGRQKKLSTRFSEITDLIRESHYWARQEGSALVTDKHVEKAYEEKVSRVNLIEDKIQEMIEDGVIMIDTEGAVVGQINGLSVYDLGDHLFGKPSRITAKTSIGRAGVINIEREAKLSGKTHDKGVLILEGYFRGKYAQDKPLTMSASLCFEQSYSGVDGDSASSTEVYAIMSSLANLPIRQDLAVTGSVNQKGEIQPIGGVNYKVEGFYDVCRAKGLTGTQGVLIPALNVPELMLRKDVVEAVRQGRFHIYPVRTIDEGIAILTGVEAGERDETGQYPENTVNRMVDERLKNIALSLKTFGEEEKKPGQGQAPEPSA